MIGDNITIGGKSVVKKGVKIGCYFPGTCTPESFVTIGNNVTIEGYAEIRDQIVIGNRARIGKCAIVTSDVPRGTTVPDGACP